MAFHNVTKGDVYTITEAIQIKAPKQTYNILSASATIKLLVGTQLVTFAPHPNFGLGDFSDVSASLDPTAPSWTFNILPYHPSVIEEFCDPALQSSKVSYWSAVVDDQTGNVLDSRLMWRGIINTQIAKLDSDSPLIEIETITTADLLMKPNEAERLTVAWQEEHFPNEKGLQYNDSAAKIPYWGIDVQRSGQSSGGSGGMGLGASGGSYGGGYLMNAVNQHYI